MLSCSTLEADIRLRVEQLWSAENAGWISPFSYKLPFDAGLQSEYGADACRIAVIAGNCAKTENELEPSFKWLARLYNQLGSSRETFAAVPWLETAIQTRDHVIGRNDPAAALTQLKHAVKVSPPGLQLTTSEKALVTACLYPFAPLLAMHYAGPNDFSWQKLPITTGSFADFICVRFAIEHGGWNQKVFDRRRFVENPLRELKTLKQVCKALGDRPAKLVEVEGGLRICFL